MYRHEPTDLHEWLDATLWGGVDAPEHRDTGQSMQSSGSSKLGMQSRGKMLNTARDAKARATISQGKRQRGGLLNPSKRQQAQLLNGPVPKVPPGWRIGFRLTAESERGTRVLLYTVPQWEKTAFGGGAPT